MLLYAIKQIFNGCVGITKILEQIALEKPNNTVRWELRVHSGSGDKTTKIRFLVLVKNPSLPYTVFFYFFLLVMRTFNSLRKWYSRSTKYYAIIITQIAVLAPDSWRIVFSKKGRRCVRRQLDKDQTSGATELRWRHQRYIQITDVCWFKF